MKNSAAARVGIFPAGSIYCMAIIQVKEKEIGLRQSQRAGKKWLKYEYIFESIIHTNKYKWGETKRDIKADSKV